MGGAAAKRHAECHRGMLHELARERAGPCSREFIVENVMDFVDDAFFCLDKTCQFDSRRHGQFIELFEQLALDDLGQDIKKRRDEEMAEAEVDLDDLFINEHLVHPSSSRW